MITKQVKENISYPTAKRLSKQVIEPGKTYAKAPLNGILPSQNGANIQLSHQTSLPKYNNRKRHFEKPSLPIDQIQQQQKLEHVQQLVPQPRPTKVKQASPTKTIPNENNPNKTQN